MNFSELNKDNFLLFAIKYYENPKSSTAEDFEEDLNRFKYVKRWLRKYHESGTMNSHLLLNHILIILNAIELEQCRKKYKDQTEWSTWLPCLDRKGLNELQHKYLKLFPNSNITKKKINRFLNRLIGAIPD